MQFAVTTGRDGAPGAGEGASWRRCLDAGEGAPSPGGLEQSARTTSPPPRRGGRSPQDPENAARGGRFRRLGRRFAGEDPPRAPEATHLRRTPLASREMQQRKKNTPAGHYGARATARRWPGCRLLWHIHPPERAPRIGHRGIAMGLANRFRRCCQGGPYSRNDGQPGGRYMSNHSISPPTIRRRKEGL